MTAVPDSSARETQSAAGSTVPQARASRRRTLAPRMVVLAALLCQAALALARPGARGARSTVASETIPPPTEVTDPLLAPAPAAPKLLQSLSEALSLLRTHSPELLATLDNVTRAEAQSRIALAAALPTLTATGTYTHQFLTLDPSVAVPGVVPSDAVVGTITLTQPLLAPRAFYNVGTARRGVQATQAALSDKRRTLATTVVNTLLSSLAAERVAVLNRIGLRAALERLALTQLKQKLGSGTLLDSERAEQDAVSARSLVLTGDEALRRAREALGLVLGSVSALGAPGDLNLNEFERAVVEVCRPSDAIEKRPDVIAARLRLAIAERGINDGWLQFAPTLTLQSQLSSTDHPLPGYPNTIWNIQGVLSLPLWDGGARYGALKDARAQADQAAQALTAVRLGAIVDVAQATRAVSVVAGTRDLAQAQRDLAEHIDQRTREAYLRGSGTSLDLVTSGAALRQAELGLAVLQLQAAQARVDAVLANADCIY